MILFIIIPIIVFWTLSKKLRWRKRYNPESIMKPVGEYSHVIRSQAKNYLIIAGQAGINIKGEIGKNFEEQAILTFQNIEKILVSQKLNFSNIVKLNIYLTDMKDRPKLTKIRSQFIKKDFAAMTLVEVTALALPELMIEIEGIASS